MTRENPEAFPKTIKERAELYVRAAHEVRFRLRCVDELLVSETEPIFISEFCHLQLRLACECLAIACLAAQGDFATHKAFRDAHEPGKIFDALARLYPGFFPTPSRMISTGKGSWHFDDVGQGYAISREGVVKIWNLSGSRLHRGSAKRYLLDDLKFDLLDIAKQKEMVWNLVLNHLVVLSDRSSRLHVSVDRNSDLIRCHFLFLDPALGQARVEVYDASSGAEN